MVFNTGKKRKLCALPYWDGTPVGSQRGCKTTSDLLLQKLHRDIAAAAVTELCQETFPLEVLLCSCHL